MKSSKHSSVVQSLVLKQGEGSYSGNVNQSIKNHLYRFQVKQHSQLNLGLTGMQADADLVLLNGKGQIVTQSRRHGRSAEAIASTVNPGTYYVQVQRQQGSTRYRLKLSVAPDAEMTAQASTSSDPSTFAQQVLDLTNAYRHKFGLHPLRLNAQLTASAQAHSQDMALNDFFGHTGSNGTSAYSRIAATGYNYMSIAENIAASFATPQAVVRAWINSPEHRENLLFPSLKEVGIGYYFLANDTGNVNYHSYWTQDFGIPKPA